MTAKKYSIKVEYTSFIGENREKIVTGTLKELIEDFRFVLACGQSWEYEKGNKKINTQPKTIASLITNLNNAESNRTRCCQMTFYSRVEQ